MLKFTQSLEVQKILLKIPYMLSKPGLSTWKYMWATNLAPDCFNIYIVLHCGPHFARKLPCEQACSRSGVGNLLNVTGRQKTFI